MRRPPAGPSAAKVKSVGNIMTDDAGGNGGAHTRQHAPMAVPGTPDTPLQDHDFAAGDRPRPVPPLAPASSGNDHFTGLELLLGLESVVESKYAFDGRRSPTGVSAEVGAHAPAPSNYGWAAGAHGAPRDAAARLARLDNQHSSNSLESGAPVLRGHFQHSLSVEDDVKKGLRDQHAYRTGIAASFRAAFHQPKVKVKAKKLMERSTRDFMENLDAHRAMLSLHCILIASSVLSYCLETLEELSSMDFRYWVSLELFFTVTFTLELTFRYVAAVQTRALRKFICDPLIWVDIVSIVPFYIMALWCAAEGSSPFGEGCGDVRHHASLRILQAMKILRVFKLFRHFAYTRQIVQSFRRAYTALGPPMVFLFVSAAFFAGLLFAVENSMGDNEAFHSMTDAVYFCVVTITTVGYGDQVPSTTLGRFIASVLMVYGIVFTAMPLTIIGAEFVVARDNVNYAKKHLKHGPSWAVRHSEFTGVPESLTEGNKNAVYHIVSDQYMALSTYLGLMRKVFRAPRADRPQMELADVRACLQVWSVKQVMFLGGLSFLVQPDHSQVTGVGRTLMLTARARQRRNSKALLQQQALASYRRNVMDAAKPVMPSPRRSCLQRFANYYWALMESPASVLHGSVVLYARVALIATSIFTQVALRNMDESEATANAAFAIQCTIGAIFFAADLLSLVCAPSLFQGIFNSRIWLGAVALVPLCAQIACGITIVLQSDWVIFVGALYFARVFTVVKHLQGAQVLWHTVLESSTLLLVPLFLLVLFTIVFATALYLAETFAEGSDGGANLDCSGSIPVHDVFRAAWVIVATMTTVGYGDGFPVTPAGKVVCMCAMMFGVLYMAMPIAIVGNNFYDLFKLRHKSHGYKPRARVTLPARHRAIMDTYMARARRLAGLLSRLDLATHVNWKNVSRLQLQGGVPECVYAAQNDSGMTMETDTDAVTARRGSEEALRAEIRKAHAELREAHVRVAGVMDHIVHRFNEMVYHNGVWVKEVGRHYRARVQKVVKHVGKHYVEMKKAASKPSNKGGDSAVAASLGSIVGSSASLSPGPALRHTPSAHALRQMHMPDDSSDTLSRPFSFSATPIPEGDEGALPIGSSVDGTFE